MKTYVFLLLLISHFYSCIQDTSVLVTPEQKYCIHPTLDTLIKSWSNKISSDTSFYVKGIFNGTSRSTHLICLEDHSIFINSQRKTLNFKLQFHMYQCDSFFMSSYRLLDKFETINMINDTFFYINQIDESPRIVLADNVEKLKNIKNSIEYEHFGLWGDFKSRNNYVVINKITNDSIVEGSFEFELNNEGLSRKMIVKDGKFRAKARLNSCSN